MDRLCAKGEDLAIVFARTPVPGRVKSRLFTRLRAEQACRLHCAATLDTAALLDQALPAIRKWIFFSESPTLGSGSPALELPESFGVATQEGNDLGERMAAAFTRAFACGARRVVIFGSDSPTLPSRRVQEGFTLLSDSDLVLGPTEDGGYYLIGCSRFDPALFRGVEWSSPRTFEQTRANAARLDFQVQTLETWYDLDEWKDVKRLLADVRKGQPLPFHLAGFLRELELEGVLSTRSKN